MKRLTRRIVAPLLEGSIPSSHPIIIRFLSLGRSQVGKARDFDSRMRWFESSRPSQCDPLAQSVEHLTFNQGVPRSSRGWITIFCLFASVAELADALDLGSSAFGVQVRLLSLAPLVLMHPLGCFFFDYKVSSGD